MCDYIKKRLFTTLVYELRIGDLPILPIDNDKAPAADESELIRQLTAKNAVREKKRLETVVNLHLFSHKCYHFFMKIVLLADLLLNIYNWPSFFYSYALVFYLTEVLVHG